MKPISLIERVYAFCDSNFDKGKKFVLNHFLAENIPRATIYRYIQRWKNGLPLTRKHGSGRPAKIMTKKKIERLEMLIEDQTGISTRHLAKKFKCSQQHIVKTIKTKTEIKYRKRILAPHRTDQQKSVCRPRCRRLFLKFRHHEFILDDESYFTFKHSDKNANSGFWTRDIDKAPSNVKFKTKQKFEKKLLVWIAISPRGISHPFIAPSSLAINQQIYLNDCIKKRLIPFIDKYHSNKNYVFWPDLASSHYANSVISHLREKKVVFVEKADNPPCVPELRPIENFWSILKGLVYEKGWEAKNYNDLKKRIRSCIKKVDLSLVHKMVSSVASKLDSVRRNGLAS